MENICDWMKTDWKDTENSWQEVGPMDIESLGITETDLLDGFWEDLEELGE